MVVLGLFVEVYRLREGKKEGAGSQ